MQKISGQYVVSQHESWWYLLLCKMDYWLKTAFLSPKRVTFWCICANKQQKTTNQLIGLVGLAARAALWKERPYILYTSPLGQCVFIVEINIDVEPDEV